jgi:hypothetical protein
VATTNYNFLQLNGSDTAGYNSINALITDIDNKLYSRAVFSGMIVAFNGSYANPTGWSDISGSGLPTLSGSYKWIVKD